jgi:predicted TIM-barrel fold metal-dependent hydrolase
MRGNDRENGTSEESGVLDMSELPWIISVDDHVVEPPTVWVDRLPAKYRDTGPRVVQDTCLTVPGPLMDSSKFIKGGDGPLADWWIYEDLAKPIPLVVACAGVPPEKLHSGPILYEDMRMGCYDPVARLDDMDVNHTERSLCFPFITRFCGQMFLEAEDKVLADLCVKAYNDWMVDEWCAGSNGRLIPLCIVPLWNPEQAGAEVRRNAARGCRAVTFSEMPSNLGLPSIHDPSRYWDPFFAACEETGTVVCMHIGSGSRMVESSPFAPRLVDVTLTFNNAQLSMVEWVMSGLLVRFPTLKIAYSESQIGWMPFVIERMDKVFVYSKSWAGTDVVLPDLPSSYIPGRIYGCFFDDETGIANREAIGVDQIVFEIDYPHQDSTWPNSMTVVEQIASQVSGAELEKIVRGNAIEMLGLEDSLPGGLATGGRRQSQK